MDVAGDAELKLKVTGSGVLRMSRAELPARALALLFKGAQAQSGKQWRSCL